MNYCVYCMEKLGPEKGQCSKCHKQQMYSPPKHHLLPGALLQNRYLTGRALGEGGFGITYIGRDTMLDMRVAIKEFYPSGYSYRMNSVSNQVTMTNGNGSLDHEKDMQRFLAEARILGKLSGESGIVGVRDFFRENGTAYIVMEYLDGLTLKEYLKRGGVLPAKTVFAMLDPVMASLGRIHEQSLIHRDISPDNIMVLRNGELKLLDFGAARDTSGDGSLSVVLKHGYAPVEQYQSRGNQGPWTDVYALCATMYKCITGITPLEALERIYQDDLKRPSEMGISMDPRQEAALMKGLQVRAQDRFQSMAQLRAGLKVQTEVHNASAYQMGEDKTIPVNRKRSSAPPSGEDRTVLDGVYRYDGSAIRPERVQKKQEAPQSGAYRYSGSAIAPEEISSERKQAEHKSGKEQRKESAAVQPPKSQPEPAAKKKKKPGILLLKIMAWCIAIGVGISFLDFIGSQEDSGAVSQQTTAAVSSVSYTLSPVGTISDPNRDIRISEGLYKRVGDNIQPLTYMGESKVQELLPNDYTAIEYLGEDLYTIQTQISGGNHVGLMDKDGELLIPCEAAIIDWAIMSAYDEHPNRYLLVAYATEPTSSEAEIVMSLSDYDASFGKTYFEGTNYKGNVKLYDIQTRSFVGDIVITKNPVGTVIVCRDTFAIAEEAGVTVYNASGEKVMTLSQEASVGPGFYLDYSDEIYRVLDESGAELYRADGSDYHYIIYGTKGYLGRWRGEDCTVLDTSGNTVLEVTGKRIFFTFADVFEYVDTESQSSGLIRKDGTILLREEKDNFTSYMGHGLLVSGSLGNKYSLLNEQGVIASGLPSSDLTITEGDKAFVIADGDFTLDIGDNYPLNLADAMIAVMDEERKYCVYDLFTGEQLLPNEYESIAAAGEYLYAYKGGIWEVYTYSLG